jgi:hypothetical protein
MVNTPYFKNLALKPATGKSRTENPNAIKILLPMEKHHERFGMTNQGLFCYDGYGGK